MCSGVADIYFQVNNGEDTVFQSLTSENNFVVWNVSWKTCICICMYICIDTSLKMIFYYRLSKTYDCKHMIFFRFPQLLSFSLYLSICVCAPVCSCLCACAMCVLFVHASTCFCSLFWRYCWQSDVLLCVIKVRYTLVYCAQ